MWLTVVGLIAGLALLVISAERFVFGASALARSLNVSPLLIGVLIVGFGTSAPEMLVSVIAAVEGQTGMAIGNAIGSNITNIALILGLAAVIRPMTIHSQVLGRELPILLAAMLIGWVLLSNGRLDRGDGALLVLAFCAMVYWMIQVARRSQAEAPTGLDTLALGRVPDIPRGRAVFWLIAGLVLLLASSRLLVWAAVDLAGWFGLSDLVIGLTVVAVGTSLPELASSVAAAAKGEDDIAVGNIVGSNTFNTLAVLGFPGLIAPGAFAPEILTRDVPFMMLLTLVMFAMSYGSGGPGRINRVEGALLLGAFVLFQWLVFSGVTVLVG